MATTVLGLKTFTASDPVDYNEINDNYNKIDNGVKTALQGRAAYNLLDNSDFRIAQAGYGGMHGTTKYACDRWYDTYGYGSFSFDESQGLTITYGTNHAYLVQKINNASQYHNKTMTVALQLSDGTTYVNSGTYLSSGISFRVSASNWLCDLHPDRIELVVTSDSLTVKWVAIYEGSYTADTLPAYQPKGYAAELAECQMYYRRGLQAVTIGTMYTTGSIFSLYFPKMRIHPTINILEITSQGWGDVDINNYTQGWGEDYGNDHFVNFTSSITADVGKTVIVKYENSADL